MIPDEQRGPHSATSSSRSTVKVGTIATEPRRSSRHGGAAIEPRRFVNRGLCSSATLLDAYLLFVAQTLEGQYPRLRATRLFEMIRDRGYKGSVYAVRRHVRRVRPAPSEEVFFRLTVLPGEQAQVDWGSFGKIRVGQGERALSCFVMVLASSRATFARFTLDQTLESLRSLPRGGVPAVRAFPGPCSTTT